MEWVILFGYSIALAIICAFSIEQFNLAMIYRRFKSKKSKEIRTIISFPKVTVQLPVYNEKYVIERLIDCVCQLEYPKDKLEIQVLDDSNDETLGLSKSRINYWSGKGVNITLVVRENRDGFKAGALAHGLTKSNGEFIAIFDADFLPGFDFLLKTIPYFDEGIGMVQTKWGHINEDYSLLTKMQAFGLNAHFSIEQTGRASSGKFMNFNGTAGVWRKTCIEEAGGWQHDTLTEDLDLSYRAQMKGWKFVFMEGVVTPAELPVIVPAIKSQQYRWNKGAAETARKNLGTILKSKISKTVKFHAAMHLLSSTTFVFLLIASMLSLPMLILKASNPNMKLAYDMGSIFVIGFLAMAFFYWISSKSNRPFKTIQYYLFHFPLFVMFSMGMSLHNAIAVTEGYLGFKTPFIRTPKFAIQTKADSWKGNIYLSKVISPITLFEGLLAIYFAFAVAYGLYIGDYGLILFHLMLTFGFGAVFIYTISSLDE
ncbi:MAG: cellulose synthase/poly-beta-1,6-N-acetylglucosamine synthase-like glycosyltransferase [Cyclobacteriaceae bacterium]|jgi:cellulose synthase/poly-beta-1,6-N-acetylglucosamine synthase-like glycosyltransferase